MIASSRFAAVSAVVLAFGVHGAVLVDYSDPKQVQIEGGGPIAIAALGNSFADLAQGIDTPMTPDDAIKPTRLEQIKPRNPPRSSEVRPAQKTSPPPVSTAKPAPKLSVTKSAKQPPVKTRIEPSQTPAAVQPATRLKAIPKEKPTPKPRKKATQEPPQESAMQPKGNSKKSTRKGTATGNRKTKAGQSGGKSKPSKTQGNAAVSNYPGIVFRKISRAKRRRVKAKGKVRVGFRIARNGTLASVSILRSSGSTELDQIAVAQIRSAAPFPAPPSGAKTSFSLEIRGR